MDILKDHEIFEIGVLEKLSSAKMLEPLVFGGGTMLRLCHELDRYSVDLDFWFVKQIANEPYFQKLKKVLGAAYEVTDAKIKHYTILFEVRSADYPKRLKIEIRKEIKNCDFQDRIAFSKYSTTQVILRTHTLEQTMKNKVKALLDRKEIRDAFDIEFLLRKGISLPAPAQEGEQASGLKKIVNGFKEKDFKVKLGSIVESKTRQYYVKNGFSYLLEKLQQ